jgi:outer membrane protein OmpA-like peptidoglycan-associated protein
LAFSQTAYKAVLEVEPSAADKEILGMDKVEASVEGSVEIDTGIVMEPVAKNEWRITMTTFRFDPNEATFNRLDAAGKKELDETLEKLVKKFNSVDGAHVTVEGYANNISGTREENEKDLLPLSQKRAEAIMELLAERGIVGCSLFAVGIGILLWSWCARLVEAFLYVRGNDEMDTFMFACPPVVWTAPIVVALAIAELLYANVFASPAAMFAFTVPLALSAASFPRNAVPSIGQAENSAQDAEGR